MIMSLLKAAWVLVLPIAIALSGSSPASATSSVEARCVKSESNFKPAAPLYWFEVVLTNSCARQLACKVDASVTDAKGVHTGTGALALAKGSAAAPANAAYRLQIGAAGGTGEVSFSCR
jgi:hypothetical protein